MINLGPQVVDRRIARGDRGGEEAIAQCQTLLAQHQASLRAHQIGCLSLIRSVPDDKWPVRLLMVIFFYTHVAVRFRVGRIAECQVGACPTKVELGGKSLAQAACDHPGEILDCAFVLPGPQEYGGPKRSYLPISLVEAKS